MTRPPVVAAHTRTNTHAHTLTETRTAYTEIPLKLDTVQQRKDICLAPQFIYPGEENRRLQKDQKHTKNLTVYGILIVLYYDKEANNVKDKNRTE